MVIAITSQNAAHQQSDLSYLISTDTPLSYTFANFFHPFVDRLIKQLNTRSLAGFFDADEHEKWAVDFFGEFYETIKSNLVQFAAFPQKTLDLANDGAYANYNWELLFHFPFAVAVHLSKNQRFAEAQRWFHYIFDPTDTSKRYWRFLGFRQAGDLTPLDEQLVLLSKDDPTNPLREALLKSYNKIKDYPFQPHPVAQLRIVPYQYAVIMKYLDNLIAWGDSLFLQDTIESINEATQIYVLTANILGERPQRIPPRGTIRPRTFHQLKNDTVHGLDELSNALVELEGQFPFNFGTPSTSNPDEGGPLGNGPALYFSIPPNDKLLGYWDIVSDRLFKIRHCMNIEGVVRQLALFDPPIDPGMLVKAVAAGLSIGSILGGLNQPLGPLRAPVLIQKALELASEVRGLGAALLSAIEKGDGEQLALLRQDHEVRIQKLTQDVRFLQWKQAQEATESLLKGRATTVERYHYYLRVLGLEPDANAGADTLSLDRQELTEANFDEAYAALVGQYDQPITGPEYPKRETSDDGTLHLLVGEYDDLNGHADRAFAFRVASAALDGVTAGLSLLPDLSVKAAFWGIGPGSRLAGGSQLSAAGGAARSALTILADNEQWQGQYASKTASYERRADDWILQSNLAARELMQIGQQILGSLIGEQVAHREYANVQAQIEQSEAVDQVLREKYTNADLYVWMQGELSRLYYEYYRFAFDTARKAEQTVKRELMRPEVDATDYIKFNYWDGGRRGLLAGEALHLDIKRLEAAYQENNKRELELTKHVSLRQLNPLALLTLKATGTCEVTIPEWLYDFDCAGQYARRIKTVSLSMPSTTGPFTSVSCTLSLLKSSLRKSPLLKDGEYTRSPEDDDRFVDYFGTVQSIVTSSGNNDSGMFETNLNDSRFLPFEGAGAESKWRLELPGKFRQFDYDTISDVILHVRYTARQGGSLLAGKVTEYLEELVSEVNGAGAGLAILFSLKHDFPGEWHKFVVANANSAGPSVPFTANLRRDHFPYFTQRKDIIINSIQLRRVQPDDIQASSPSGLDLPTKLEDQGGFNLSLAPDDAVLLPSQAAQVFVLIKYTLE